MMKKRLLFYAFIFLLLPLGIKAQNADLGGYVKILAHPNLNKPYPFDHLGSRLQLHLSGSLNQQAAFYSALDFNYEAAGTPSAYDAPRSAGLTVYPVETYLDLFFKYLDVRLGQQFIFWGKTDWVNPTDNINPWDYVNVSAEIEDYRLPVMAAKADFYLGPVDLQAVWLPRFLAAKTPLALPDSMGGFAVEQPSVHTPQNKLANSAFALKADFSFWNVDYALSYYRGFDKNPTLRMAFHPLPPNPRFSQTISYGRQQVFGAAFVTTFDKWAFKGEGAYFLTQDRKGKDIFLQNPYVKYVLGADYLPTNDLTLNAQFIQTILLQFDKDYELQSRRQMGMPLSTLPDEFSRSLSGRVQYKISDFTSLQLISVYNLKDGDFFVLPILNYALSDGVNIYGGATVFSGPEHSPFGRSKDYSRGFVEVKYSF